MISFTNFPQVARVESEARGESSPQLGTSLLPGDHFGSQDFKTLTPFSQSGNPSFRFPGLTTTGSQFLPSTFSPSYTSAFPFPSVSSPSSTTSATSPFPFPSSSTSTSTSPSSYTAFPFPSSSAGYNPLLPQQPLPRQDSSKEGPRMHNGKKVYKKKSNLDQNKNFFQVRSARTIYSASQIHQLEAR